MRYERINSELFIQNRSNLIQKFKPKSIAIIHSNDILPSNADGTLGFKQNSDFFYLSGIDQEESILILFPDCLDEQLREILFIKQTDEHIKTWEGEKLTKREAQEVSGIKKVFWVHQFDAMLPKLLFYAENVYLNLNEHDGANVSFESRERRFLNQFRQQFPLHSLHRLAPFMHELRVIKHTIEIELLKKAIEITKKGFERMARFLRPGVFEYELEAELTHEFLINRSRGHAFSPILASGKNACILHYITNHKPCLDGDIILMDFGAEYANYNADTTRCLPVNGKFSPRQKEVYQSVLRILKESSKLICAGNNMYSLRESVGEMMEEELIRLGLLRKTDILQQNPESPLYRKYFPHGISHHLGLDVHDVGSRYETFKPGMIFTCEPGIYIPEENLGIRLENDILIQEKGNIDLMANIPIEIEDIEQLMQSNIYKQ